MNFEIFPRLMPVAVLLAAGWLLRPLEEQITRSAESGGASREQLTTLAGSGGVLSVLGGLRSTAASAFWLRANVAWEERDAAATCALLELTVAADERPLYFWLNGARIIACDLPEWQRAEAPASVRKKINEELARRGIAWLEKGVRWHGPDSALYVEIANLQLRRLGDLAGAAENYRRAAEQPGAPFYAARIHGELLCALGRRDEALRWLRTVVKDLPANDPAARRDVVAARIAVLEREVEAGAASQGNSVSPRGG